jgi:hypothetical protein
MKAVARPFLAIALSGASVLMTGTLVHDAVSVAARSDAELLEVFGVSAYGDVFGFGFWPTWTVCLLVQLFVAGGGWLLVGKHQARFLFPALLLAFTIGSVLNYSSYERQHALWVTQER